MAEKTSSPARPDVDILEDVNDVFHTYPPLAHDRPRITMTVDRGKVKATGNVKTPGARQRLEAGASAVAGVKQVDVSKLYDDNTIMVQAASSVPVGVYVAVSYGAIIVYGQPPKGTRQASLVGKLKKIKGVRTVISKLEENAA